MISLGYPTDALPDKFVMLPFLSLFFLFLLLGDDLAIWRDYEPIVKISRFAYE